MNPVAAGLLLSLTLSQTSIQVDEAAVREVVKKYVDARDRSDAKGIEALFTEDADQLTSSGAWRKGRGEIVKGTLASSKANPASRRITIETVRFPAEGVAIADGRYEIGARQMWTSFVMVRTANIWRIASIRNMLPAPPETPASGERR